MKNAEKAAVCNEIQVIGGVWYRYVFPSWDTFVKRFWYHVETVHLIQDVVVIFRYGYMMVEQYFSVRMLHLRPHRRLTLGEIAFKCLYTEQKKNCFFFLFCMPVYNISIKKGFLVYLFDEISFLFLVVTPVKLFLGTSYLLKYDLMALNLLLLQ